MAEQPKTEPAEVKEKKKLPLKMLLIIAGVAIMEVATIGTVWVMRGGQPTVAEATNPIEQTNTEKTITMSEIVMASGSVDNHIGGRAKMIVTLEVAAKVEDSKKDQLKAQVDTHQKEIMNMVREVVAAVQPTELKDPKLQVVKRELLLGVENIIEKGLISEILISDWQTYVSE